MTFTIRNALPADLDAIMRIEREAFIPLIQEAAETFAERLSVFPEGFFLLEAENTGEVCGYFCSELWDAPHTDGRFFALGHSAKNFHTSTGSTLYISSMGILPEQRGKGLGRKLFTEACTRTAALLPQIRTMLLIVNEQWLSARKIYASTGFVETERLPDFFPVEDDTQNGSLAKCHGNLRNNDCGIIMERIL